MKDLELHDEPECFCEECERGREVTPPKFNSLDLMHLKWVYERMANIHREYERMANIHREDQRTDYMRRFKEILQKLDRMERD